MSNCSKCDNCGKNLTKKIPGLECKSCGKVVHATQICTGLTAKQIAALRNTDCLDWTCEECQRESPRRKSSFVIPDEDEEEEEEVATGGNVGSCNIDTNKFLKDITSEMKKVLKKELQPIETSVGICCSKIDDLSKVVESHNKEIKDLGRKCTHLKNEQTHLHLEISALKHYVRNIDQQRLDSVLEVFGVPKLQDENVNDIASKLAGALNMDIKEVLFVKRMDGRNGRDGVIQVGLQQIKQAEQWVRAAKTAPVTVQHLINEASPNIANLIVMLRRALTKANKKLLWQAQQKLRPAFKYVWFQDGKVLARKNDNAKPLIARSEEDIDNLVTQEDKDNMNR